MEDAAFGLICLVGGFGLLTFALAIAAFTRTGDLPRLRKRILQLETEADGLRRKLAAVSAAATAAPAPEPANSPASPVPAPATPTVSSPAVPPPVVVSPVPPPTNVPPVSPSVAPPPRSSGAADSPALAAWKASHQPPKAPPPRQPPPVPPRPPRPPSPPSAPINWEKIIGVSVASVGGGVVLMLAAFFLVKISIERGWISPSLRVAVAAGAGMLALFGSDFLRRRKNDYAAVANALSGAGIVILYSAVWSARVMYHLEVVGDVGPAFGLMALITVVACLLSIRYASLVVALLGLVGGFLTPLLINTGHDNPIGLFGYVLLLDVGLLAVAHRQKWATLQILSMLGTVLLEGLWIFARMGQGTAMIGLCTIGLFGGVFAVSGVVAPKENRVAWLFGQTVGVLVPFLFALYFAGNANLGSDPLPLLALMVLLTALAGFLGSREPFDLLGPGAAGGATAVVAVLLVSRDWPVSTTWVMVGMTVLIALIPHLFAEGSRDLVPPKGSGAAAAVAAAGMLCALILGSLRDGAEPVGPWLVGEVALSLLLLRQGGFAGRSWLQLAPAVLLPIGLVAWQDVHLEGRFPSPPVWLAMLGMVAAIFQANAVIRREAPVRRFADHAAALAALFLLAGVTLSDLYFRGAPLPALGLVSVLTFFAVLASTRLRDGAWFCVAVVAGAGAHVLWSQSVAAGSNFFWGRSSLDMAGQASILPLCLMSVTVILLTAWPFLAGTGFKSGRMAWRAAALAGPLWFLALRSLWINAFGTAAIGILPLGLAVVSFVAVVRASENWPQEDPIRRSVLAWFAAAALGFLAAVFPQQFDHQWITLGWALQGLAVIALWVRLDHRGLKYFGLFLFAIVTARLVLNPAVLDYESSGGPRIVNWLLYTYGVPAVALLAAAQIMGRKEIERARGWEKPLYEPGEPVGLLALSTAAIAVVFVLINLEVLDWFSGGEKLSLVFERMQSRDLAFSISWLVYAVLLLVIGIWRQARGPRWLSLALLLGSILKVVFYDMGALHDFKRVFAFAGLGVSLIVVALVYSRFLFGSTQTPQTRPAS